MPSHIEPPVISCAHRPCAALDRVAHLEKEVAIWYREHQSEKKKRLAAESRESWLERRLKRVKAANEELRQGIIDGRKREDTQYREWFTKAKTKKAELAAKLKERDGELKALRQKVEELGAECRLLRQKRFGRSTEKYSAATGRTKKRPKRRRGQQRGVRGHGRKDHSHLPEQVEVVELPACDRHCGTCGLEKIPMTSTEDSEQVEVHVKAHRRVIKRRKYRTGCDCPGTAKIVTAPLPAKLIPKSPYGASVWAQALIEKYLFQRPVHKFIEAMHTQGLTLPQGTLTGGFKRLSPLFDPIVAEIVHRSRGETHWHADETGWRVFEEVEGKEGQKWWLWVFRTKSTAVFMLDPTRSATVPRDLLGDDSTGIISADRFSSYKALTKDGRFKVAFCWAHVRRDFVELIPQPKHRKWAIGWIDRIAYLYKLNDDRVAALAKSDMLAFQIAHQNLAYHLCLFALTYTVQAMATEMLSQKQIDVLKALESHWSGLTIFYEYPEIPMDNNPAERELRGLVVGRKNYYGSGAVWSGELAAKLYSIFRTLNIWHINPQTWLASYLDACAHEGGIAPKDATSFLPWNMPAGMRRDLTIVSKTTSMDVRATG